MLVVFAYNKVYVIWNKFKIRFYLLNDSQHVTQQIVIYSMSNVTYSRTFAHHTTILYSCNTYSSTIQIIKIDQLFFNFLFLSKFIIITVMDLIDVKYGQQ